MWLVSISSPLTLLVHINYEDKRKWRVDFSVDPSGLDVATPGVANAT